MYPEHDTQGDQRVSGQGQSHVSAARLAPVERQRGIEEIDAVGRVFNMDEQLLVGNVRAPAVVDLHGHERGDVEALGRVEALRAGRTLIVPVVEDIAVPFAPGRVVDLGDQRFEAFTRRVETVVETDRVEAMPEVAQVGQ